MKKLLEKNLSKKIDEKRWGKKLLCKKVSYVALCNTYIRLEKMKWKIKLENATYLYILCAAEGGGRSPLYISVCVAVQHMRYCFASARLPSIYQVCSGTCFGHRARQFIFSSKAYITHESRPKCIWLQSILTSTLVEKVFQNDPS